MPPRSAPPVVAIVGRPNVGKSTLFNRWGGRALVEDTPGLTRDRIAEEIEVEGRHILLVDTAGLDPDVETDLGSAVQAQAQLAVDEADAIVFVVDGKAGLLPEDERLATALRRTTKPLAVAVNKIDHPKHRDRVAEFHRLGFDLLEGISATHGTAAWDLLETLVAKLPPAPKIDTSCRREPDAAIRIAIVGRPNVGKSSLLNCLAGQERVVVCEEPGTTRDAVDIRLTRGDEEFVLVDTAGLRRPGRRSATGEWGGALLAIRAIERADVALVLIDASEGFTDQDARVAGLVRKRGCAAAILINKWDLVTGEDASRRIRDEAARRLRFMADAPIVTLSAKTGAHVERIFPLTQRLAATAGRQIPTAELNRWLADATARHEPAMGQRGTRRRPIKFFYATQTAVRPPTFVLFCTDPQTVRVSYRRFLENRLREDFDLGGVPIRLRLRARGQAAERRGAK